MAKKNQLTKSDYLPINDFKKLLDKLREDKQYIWELYARVSFGTALRASDVLTLTWADVLNRSSLIKTEKKTKKTRKIPLNKTFQERINVLYTLLKRPNPNELMFLNKHTGLPFSIQYVNRVIKTWKEKYHLHIDHFSTHTFRKTFGRYSYDKNPNKSEALMLLNNIFKHSSLEITKIYICITDEEINSIYDSAQF